VFGVHCGKGIVQEKISVYVPAPDGLVAVGTIVGVFVGNGVGVFVGIFVGVRVGVFDGPYVGVGVTV